MFSTVLILACTKQSLGVLKKIHCVVPLILCSPYLTPWSFLCKAPSRTSLWLSRWWELSSRSQIFLYGHKFEWMLPIWYCRPQCPPLSSVQSALFLRDKLTLHEYDDQCSCDHSNDHHLFDRIQCIGYPVKFLMKSEGEYCRCQAEF